MSWVRTNRCVWPTRRPALLLQLLLTLPTDRGDNRIWGETPLPMPVLAVGATGGYGAASAETVRRVARNVRDVLIERSGHYIPEERPDALAGAITDFTGR